jgi:uncharacterized membrane protein
VHPYHLHPMLVHFPIAILLLGLIACGIGVWRPTPERASAARALLWIGTLALWATLALGLVAAHQAPHVPPAWEVLADHRTLGWWTAGLFTGLSVGRVFLPERLRAILFVAWLVAYGVLVATAYHGALLVYQYGMGVASGN